MRAVRVLYDKEKYGVANRHEQLTPSLTSPAFSLRIRIGPARQRPVFLSTLYANEVSLRLCELRAREALHRVQCEGQTCVIRRPARIARQHTRRFGARED